MTIIAPIILGMAVAVAGGIFFVILRVLSQQQRDGKVKYGQSATFEQPLPVLAIVSIGLLFFMMMMRMNTQAVILMFPIGLIVYSILQRMGYLNADAKAKHHAYDDEDDDHTHYMIGDDGELHPVDEAYAVEDYFERDDQAAEELRANKH